VWPQLGASFKSLIRNGLGEPTNNLNADALGHEIMGVIMVDYFYDGVAWIRSLQHMAQMNINRLWTRGEKAIPEKTSHVIPRLQRRITVANFYRRDITFIARL
jgi:hypothetical protein